MQNDDAYLLDMLLAAHKAVRFAHDLDYEQFTISELHQNAIFKVLTIIGESASRISVDTREAHSEIPWSQIVSLRNRIVHGYFEIDMDVIWNIVRDDIPKLICQLKQIVPPEAG